MRKAGQYVYHLACFSCDICMRQLSTGEQFTISLERKNAVRLLCRLHFAVEKQPHSPQAASASQEARMSSSPTLSFDFNYSQSPECSGNNQNNNNKFHTQRQQPQQVHNNSASFLHLFASTSTNNNNQNTDQQLHLINSKSDFQDSRQLVEDIQSLVSIQQRATTSGSASSSNCSTGGLLALQSKSKRVRTTFTEDQLSILQTHFQIDSNPDGQDLERIATITGLSKRVTQVWFQNSRARQKKYMIKRKPSASLAASSALATCSKLHSQHQQQQQQHHQAQQETRSGLVGEHYLQVSQHERHKWSTNMSIQSEDFSLDDNNGDARLTSTDEEVEEDIDDADPLGDDESPDANLSDKDASDD